MTIRISVLEDDRSHDAAWDAFVEAHPWGMAYQTLPWRDLLCRVLPDVEPHYLMAWSEGRLVGVLPAMVSGKGPHGRVVNSLPFFGSHGSALVDEEVGWPAVAALLDALDDLAEAVDAPATNLILTPWDEGTPRLRDHWGPQLDDKRIAQMTDLTIGDDQETGAGDPLLVRYAKKRRNNVRRANKSGVTYRYSKEAQLVDWIESLHRERMAAIGGTGKPPEFFTWAKEAAEAGTCRFGFAMLDDEPIAGIIDYRFREYEEYLLPVYDPTYSETQASAGLIHDAMRTARADGLKQFNFGGTHADQHGVYKFKHEFAATDQPYTYLIKLRDEDILKVPPNELLEHYPGFYVYPFSAHVERRI